MDWNEKEKMPMGEEEKTAEKPVPGAKGPIGEEEIRKAAKTLEKYRQAKGVLDERIVDNENWFRMHAAMNRDEYTREKADPENMDSPWLFNSIINKHADAMDNYPEANILPREQGDDAAARAIRAILPVTLEQNEYEQVYSDAWWYKLKHGTAVKGIFWDGRKMNGLGDIDIRLVDMLNLFWEPGVRDIQKSHNVFHIETVDVEDIKAVYPNFDGRAEAQGLVRQYMYDQKPLDESKAEVVDWYYKKRGKLHFCKFCKDTLLYASENDPEWAERGFYDHGMYPFVFDCVFPSPSSPAGFGYIDTMKGTQRYIDRLRKGILMNAQWGVRPRYFQQIDGDVNEKEFNDISKSIVHTASKPGDEHVRLIETKPLDGNVIAMYNNLITEQKETSGNRDFSQGGTASGVTAASSIAALQEAGSKLSRDMLKASYRAFEKECRLVIELMRQFYTAPRCFRITGEDGGQQFVSFDNTALQPQTMDAVAGQPLAGRLPIFDIKVSASKKSTFSKLSQNELAKELYGAGLFAPNMVDQALICLEMMDFEGREKIVERLQQNQSLAAENAMLKDQLVQLGVIADAQNGTNITQGMVADFTSGKSAKPGKMAETLAANSLGETKTGNSMATQAARRAMNVTNPEAR